MKLEVTLGLEVAPSSGGTVCGADTVIDEGFDLLEMRDVLLELRVDFDIEECCPSCKASVVVDGQLLPARDAESARVSVLLFAPVVVKAAPLLDILSGPD